MSTFLNSLPLDDPRAAFWLPVAVFFGLGLVLFAVGRLLIGIGRSRRGEDPESRYPLIFGPFTVGLSGVLPITAEQFTGVRKEVRQAGYYRPLAAEQFLAIRNALVIGWMFVTVLAMIAAFDPVNDPSMWILIVGVAILVLLYAGPRLVLQSQARARVKKIQQQLPDGLDMITMCMTGGLSLFHAFERVGDEIRTTHGELALELDIIRRQADAHSLEHSLEQFSERIDAPEIQTLSALITQTERLGSNVASALREYADSIRRSFRQRAEERGNRSSVQLMLPVALCLAPPVYILLLAPAAIELRDFIVRENQDGGVLEGSVIDDVNLTDRFSQDGQGAAAAAAIERTRTPRENRARPGAIGVGRNAPTGGGG